MLPGEQAVAKYCPEPDELDRKMVVAQRCGTNGELVIGILRADGGEFGVRSLSVDAGSIRPLTREDIDLGLTVLSSMSV
jgi:hypothetical protein